MFVCIKHLHDVKSLIYGTISQMLWGSAACQSLLPAEIYLIVPSGSTSFKKEMRLWPPGTVLTEWLLKLKSLYTGRRGSLPAFQGLRKNEGHRGTLALMAQFSFQLILKGWKFLSLTHQWKEGLCSRHKEECSKEQAGHRTQTLVWRCGSGRDISTFSDRFHHVFLLQFPGTLQNGIVLLIQRLP